MQNNKSDRFYIIISSFVVLLLFCGFFISGLVIAYLFFTSLFGSPQEMGWLFLTVTGQIVALVFGFLGSILASFISLILIKNERKNQTNTTAPGLLVFSSYLLSLLWLLILIIIINKLTPSCPNCYK